MDRDCDCDPHHLVVKDVEAALDGAISLTSPVQSQAGFGSEPIENARFTAVAWEVKGEQTGPFAGVDPTNLPVHIKAVTLVEHLGEGSHRFHRYIDWVTVMAQLGLSASFRPAVEHL